MYYCMCYQTKNVSRVISIYMYLLLPKRASDWKCKVQCAGPTSDRNKKLSYRRGTAQARNDARDDNRRMTFKVTQGH